MATTKKTTTTEKPSEKVPAKKIAASKAIVPKKSTEVGHVAVKHNAVTPKVKQETPKPNAETVRQEKPIEKEVSIAVKAAEPADNRIKVLFATAEAFPYAGTGGLGEVAGSLPKALNKLGVDCRVIMPLHMNIAQKWREKMEFICTTWVDVGWRHQYVGIFKIENDGVITYFIDNEYYFKRAKIYGEADDAERYAYFSRAVYGALGFLGFMPDIIHSHDHATAFVPVYQQTEYWMRPEFSHIKHAFTIHNLEYQGVYPMSILGDVFGLDNFFNGLVGFDYNINSLKAAIETAHAVTTVSPTYADEILMPEHSFGLSGILDRNRQKLVGILNGVNVDEYNPETNPALAAHYSAKDPSGKLQCKYALKTEFDIEPSDRPIIAVISRLAGHKGLDFVKGLLESGYSAFNDADLIILGTGEKYLEEYFTWYAATHRHARAVITYNKDLAHRIYAGADMFLMPSLAEPCGLSQMMACRYGTIPIVRKTGGLADSIHETRGNNTGNGFVFEGYDMWLLNHAIKEAIDMYYTPAWKDLMQRAFACDFSWNVSAKEYLKLYEKMIKY